MALLKNEYEISLWEDLEDTSEQKYGYVPLLVQPLDWSTNHSHYYYLNDEDEYVSAGATWDDSKTYYDRFTKFKEYKIGVIGSDSMTSLSRAVEPCLTQNINGTNTFTFKMFYTYIDTLTGEKVDNSWILYLVNEARLKVKWKNKWYDFVIKNRVEDSGGKSVTFTCEDLFVNELSKTGFNLEFDTELENNLGTVFELAEKTLADTDWTLVLPEDTPYPVIDGKDFAPEIIKQYTEEPVYEFYGASYIKNNFTVNGHEFTNTDHLLFFYSLIENRPKSTSLQFLYSGSDTFPTETNSLLVVRDKVLRFTLSPIVWDGTNIKYNNTIILSVPPLVSGNYRAERLVDSLVSSYDANANKYVLHYTDTTNNKLTYGFSKTDYNTALMVTNLATWNTSGVEGWEESANELYWTLYPEFTTTTNISNYNAEGYVRLKVNRTLYNTGVPAHKTYLPDGLLAGYEYIIRFRAATGNNTIPNRITEEKLNVNNNTVRILVKQSNNSYDESYFTFESSRLHTETRSGTNLYWQEFKFICTKSITLKELKNVRLRCSRGAEGATLWITDFQFFLVLEDENDNIIYPGDFAAESRSAVRYYYYYPEENTSAMSLDDIDMILVSEGESSRFEPIYNDNNIKIRSISVKQSNRFNILQTLAETFLCWVKFGIVHNPNTGLIECDSDGLPKKYITFVESIGEDKGYGFVYGIDLKTILRTVLSKQLVTKTIVSANSNEFGKDGFCTIARAPENVPKTNFILNLDYYVANGMLNGGILTNDLYSKIGDNLGYYVRLKELNTAYDASLEKYTKLLNELLQQQSLLDVYTNLKSAAADERNSVEHDLMKLAGTSTMAAANDYFKLHSNDLSKALINDLARIKNSLGNYDKLVISLTTSVAEILSLIDDIERDNKNYVKQIEDLDTAFNSKYARYLLEGSWISEDYMDDSLYYLDGLSVAYTASRPQVLYSISVLRLTALEEFKNKVFDVGDIGFIEDKEFFGYEIDHITPIKEKIVISQIAEYFDSPERDTITILNYKTQFEDLFLRITSTTQSLLFSLGEYAKTTSIINSDMTIKPDLLQSSLLQNIKIITNATNESVTYDSTGLTIVDVDNPNLLVKLTSGGLVFTMDGGLTWTTGIDAYGVRPDYLKTGVINTSLIMITPTTYPTFRWDGNGISAYAWDTEHPEYGSIPSLFVRYDLYGFYGIKGYDNFDSSGYYKPFDSSLVTWEADTYYELINGQYILLNTKPDNWDTSGSIYYELLGNGLEIIKLYANFGFTWDGFFLKGDGDWIDISSNEGILIINPLWKFLEEAVTPLYDRSFNNSGEPYTTNDYIPVVTLGRFYDNYTDFLNQQYSYGLRLRDKKGYVTLTADNLGDLWSLRLLRAGNTLYNNYVRIDLELPPTNWNTNYYDYFIYDNVNKRYNTVVGVAPDFDDDTYYELVNDEYIPLVQEPSEWDTEYGNYYIRVTELGTRDFYYLPVSSVAPQWETETYYTFYDEGSIAGLNGTSLSNKDISHLTLILNKLDLIDAYEITELLDRTITVESVRTSAYNIWEYISEGEGSWDNVWNTLYIRKGNNNYVINTNNEYDLNKTYYLPSEMSLSLFNLINKLDTTKVDWVDTDYLPSGTYYIYPDELDLSEYAVRIWAGADETYSNSRFVVFKNGYVYAQLGYFEGNIHATNGNFSGKITIGTGEVHGIDGTAGAEYVIWSGKTTVNNVDEYLFYIDNTGRLYAQNANIAGTINVDLGILHELFLNTEGTSGLSDDEISIWINAGKVNNIINRETSKFYVTYDGRLYTTDVFLRGMIGIDPLDLPVYLDNVDYYVENYISVGSAAWDSTKTYYKGLYNTGDEKPSSYVLVESSSQPPDWPTDYYTKEGYKLINKIIYTLLTSDPGDLTTQYSKYYIKDSLTNRYIQLVSPTLWEYTTEGEYSWNNIWNILYIYLEGEYIRNVSEEYDLTKQYYLPYTWSENTYYIITTNGDYSINDIITNPTWIREVLYNEWIRDDTAWPTVYNTLYIYNNETGKYDKNTDIIYHEDITYYTKTLTNIYHPILIDQYYKHGINDAAHGYVFWDGDFNDPLIPTDQMLYNFYVNQLGDVYARNLELGDKLTASSVELDATLRVGNIVLTSADNGRIYNGNNWYINGEGFADFLNARVRGLLTTVSFKKDSVSAVGGSLFISPTQVLEGSFEGTETSTGSNIFRFVLNNSNPEDDDYFGLEWSTVNEISIKYNAINESGVVEEQEATAALVHNIYTLYNYGQGETWENDWANLYIINDEDGRYIKNTSSNYDSTKNYYVLGEKLTNSYFDLPNISSLAAGSIFVSTDESTSSIFLVASEVNGEVNYGPRIEMRGGPKGESTDKVIIGNLNSRLADTSFASVNNNAGSGLYANNVYLEGRFYLPQAGMTNEDDPDNINNSIRIWAGASASDRENAPFRVTHDGSLYASKGVFKGTIEATDSTFSGWLKTAGILVNDNPSTKDVLENSFYVAYDNRNLYEDGQFPTVSDLILKIDGDGLAIWEGGFKVYTDSYDTQLPSYIYKFYIALTQSVVWEVNKYYKLENNLYILLTSKPDDWEQNYSNYYIANINDKCIPYIQAVEDLTGSNYRLLTTKLQVATAIRLNNFNLYYLGIGITDNSIIFEYLSNSIEEATYNDLWNSNSFTLKYDADSFKLLSSDSNYITILTTLDENFVWSLNSGKLDLGVTGSVDVKGTVEAKNGVKIGRGLDTSETSGGYMWMKEYDLIGVFSHVPAATEAPTWESDTYYEYNIESLLYLITETQPLDWNSNYTNYYEYNESAYNDEYSGFDFFIE